MARHRFTEEERDLIREHYHEPDGVNRLMNILDVTYRHIVDAAHHMGLGPRKRERKDLKKYYRDPEPVPLEALKRGICPGKGNGPCGKRLWQEPVFSAKGYSMPGLCDLVCEAGHRFALPQAEGKDKRQIAEGGR